MKAVYYLLMLFVLGSCYGNIESCSTDDFESFEMDRIDLHLFRFLDNEFVTDLKPGITYKFKNKSLVSFVKGKDFTLLGFDLHSKKNVGIKKFQVKQGESKIQIGKCYSKCGYLGRTLKFRFKNNKKFSVPEFKIMTTGISKKIVKSNYIYVEGQFQNFGIFVEDQEFIFLPIEESSLKSREDFYMKILLVNDGLEWVAYVFYSEKEIKTDILKNLIGLSSAQKSSLV